MLPRMFTDKFHRGCSLIISPARVLVGLACLLLAILPATAAVRYVNVNNPSPVPPYTSWATAATNIQDAVDVTAPGDEVLVTNGVYRTGGRVAVPPLTNAAVSTLTNRVTVTNQILLRSVNGPEVTIIEGNTNNTFQSQVRGVDLRDGGVLVGFTITRGSAGYIFLPTSTAITSRILKLLAAASGPLRTA